MPDDHRDTGDASTTDQRGHYRNAQLRDEGVHPSTLCLLRFQTRFAEPHRNLEERVPSSRSIASLVNSRHNQSERSLRRRQMAPTSHECSNRTCAYCSSLMQSGQSGRAGMMFLRVATHACLETALELRTSLILFVLRDKFSMSNGVKYEVIYLVLSGYPKRYRGARGRTMKNISLGISKSCASFPE